jgi:predicted transposase YdaD
MDRLNPLNDYAFKQIMDKENLIPFLNAVLNPDDQKKLVSDEDALALYRAREDSAHERANLIYTGRMEGIEEGILKVAKNMLSENLSLELIAKITGLSIEEVKTLQTENNDKTH